jgi:hypothetical protein
MMVDVLTTEYDGCGRCLVATRRLSFDAEGAGAVAAGGDGAV